MDNTVNEIISLEWEMFQLVNEGGPRADCQEDYGTFYDMRYGQYSEWSAAAQSSYFEDLRTAKAAGRNLIEEKYIWMMIESAPEAFMELSSRVKMPTERAKELADKICDTLMKQTALLHVSYPFVATSGRPLYSSGSKNGVVSVESYQYSELLTYSEATLEALIEHITKLDRQKISLAELILTNSVKHYGYKTLDDAEAALDGSNYA